MTAARIAALASGVRHELDARALPSSATLADLLAASGLPTTTSCGQRGVCRKCDVELVEGTLLDLEGNPVAAPVVVRACRCRATAASAAIVRIPERARLASRSQVGDTFAIERAFSLDPPFPLSPQRDTVCAIDLGTTTVVVLLADATSGHVLARAGGFNQQMRYGDNVLTRIMHAGHVSGRRELHASIVRDTIAPLLAEACTQAGRAPSRIAGATVAGNTTMLHLLAGEDPVSLGVAPFTPVFLSARDLSAGGVGLSDVVEGLNPSTVLRLLPGLSAYVGADITAGLYATGMLDSPNTSLLVDLGTNGEIALIHGGGLWVCATAAGPAFEGAGLASGVRAQPGAIERLALSSNPPAIHARCIGAGTGVRPMGVCGSAYVDFLAEGRRAGLLLATGRFHEPFWTRLPPGNRAAGPEGRRVILAGDGAQAVTISEADVATLLQAKAAIGAGIETILRAAGLRPGDVRHLHLAGGFGLHLDVSHAIAIGLLPGVAREAVHVVGNAPLAGALLAALDASVLADMERMRERVRVFDLNADPGFEDRYVDHLSLPAP